MRLVCRRDYAKDFAELAAVARRPTDPQCAPCLSQLRHRPQWKDQQYDAHAAKRNSHIGPVGSARDSGIESASAASPGLSGQFCQRELLLRVRTVMMKKIFALAIVAAAITCGRGLYARVETPQIQTGTRSGVIGVKIAVPEFQPLGA